MYSSRQKPDSDLIEGKKQKIHFVYFICWADSTYGLHLYLIIFVIFIYFLPCMFPFLSLPLLKKNSRKPHPGIENWSHISITDTSSHHRTYWRPIFCFVFLNQHFSALLNRLGGSVSPQEKKKKNQWPGGGHMSFKAHLKKPPKGRWGWIMVGAYYGLHIEDVILWYEVRSQTILSFPLTVEPRLFKVSSLKNDIKHSAERNLPLGYWR